MVLFVLFTVVCHSVTFSSVCMPEESQHLVVEANLFYFYTVCLFLCFIDKCIFIMFKQQQQQQRRIKIKIQTKNSKR